MATKKQSAERQEAIDTLRATLKPGDTVYTILRHVSRSGMQRVISLAIARDGGGIEEIDFNAARAIDCRLDLNRGGLVVGGCGMDMGFHLVYELGRVLWPDGVGCCGKGCRSNDHSNGDRDYSPHRKSKPHWHRDSGYALRQRWL